MSTSLNKILTLYVTQFYLLKTKLLEGYAIEAFLRTWKPPLSVVWFCKISEFFETAILKNARGQLLPYCLLLSLVNLVSCYWHSIVEEWDPVLGFRTPGNHWELYDHSWNLWIIWEKEVHCNCNLTLIFLTKASWYEIWIIIVITILTLKLTFT